MPLPGLMPTSSSWLHFCGGPSSEPSIGYTGPLDTLHVTACALFTTNRLVRLAHFLSCKSVRSRAPPRLTWEHRLQQHEHAATTLLAPLKKPSALPGMPDWQVSSAGPLDTLRDIRDPFAIGG